MRKIMRKKSFKLTKEPSFILKSKIQAKGNRAMMSKLAAQLLLLIFLIGLIIYALP